MGRTRGRTGIHGRRAVRSRRAILASSHLRPHMGGDVGATRGLLLLLAVKAQATHVELISHDFEVDKFVVD